MAEVGQWNAALTSTKDIIRPRFCLDMVCTAMTLEARINIQRNNRGECLIQETYLAEQVRRQHPPQKIVTSVPSSSQHTPSPAKTIITLTIHIPTNTMTMNIMTTTTTTMMMKMKTIICRAKKQCNNINQTDSLHRT